MLHWIQIPHQIKVPQKCLYQQVSHWRVLKEDIGMEEGAMKLRRQ